MNLPATLALLASLTLAMAVPAKADDPTGIVMLPKITVVGHADKPLYKLQWTCRWPTQKSEISDVWFSKILPGGAMEKAGVRENDTVISVDGVTLRAKTGEWLEARVQQPFRAGETHTFIFIRAGVHPQICCISIVVK